MRAVRFVFALMLLAAAGCDRAPAPPAPAAGGRIVSFSPAMTQIVIDLGARDRVAGVIPFDPLEGEVAIVGDLYRYDYEKLLAIDPAVVLIQPPADGVPRKLRDLAEARGWAVRAWKIERADDALDAIRFVGDAIGRPKRAAQLRADVRAKLDRLGALTATRPTRRTLVLVGTATLTAGGPGTFIDELLTIAGGKNVLTDRRYPYPVLDREAIVALDPEAVVVIDPSADDPAAGARGPMPAALAGLGIAAVREGRVYWLTYRQALLPTSTMPVTAAAMAGLLHPDLRQRVNGIMAE